MNWISYSFMMFFSSVGTYLCVRKASLDKVPTKLINLAMFGIPLIVYIVMSLAQHTNYAASTVQLVLLLVAGVVFAFASNTASLQAIKIAPNPGYSLVLSKSYVLFTTLVAVTLLGATLTLQKAIAILIIVAFSAVIMVNPKQSHKTKDNTWIWLSLGAFFGWGMLSLTSKYLLSHGLPIMTFLVYLYIIVTLCIILISKVRLSDTNKVAGHTWWPVIGAGVFSASFNLGQFQAIKLAPNIGYVNAMNAASISLVTVMAVVLFKDELTKQKAIGIIGVTAGLILLLV